MNNTINSPLIRLIPILSVGSDRFGGFYAPFFAPHFQVSTGAFLSAIGVGSLGGILTCLISPLYDIFSGQLLFVVGELLTVAGFLL